MNWKNLLIAGSVLLNVVLLVWLASGNAPSALMAPLDAQNRSVSAGGMSATTARVTSSRQALWVLDNTEKRLIVYAFPSARGKNLDIISGRDLRKDFGENLAGELLMLPGEIPGGTEAVYVIDPVGKKLIAFESRGSTVEPIGMRDLDKDFKTGK